MLQPQPRPGPTRSPEELRRKERLLSVAVVIIVATASALTVLIPVLYMQYAQGLVTAEVGEIPTVHLSSQSLSRGGRIAVLSVTSEADLASYRFSLFKGSEQILFSEALLDGVALVKPGGTAVFVDSDGSGTLTGGDRFELSRLDPTSDYVFILYWEPTGQELGQALLLPTP